MARTMPPITRAASIAAFTARNQGWTSQRAQARSGAGRDGFVGGEAIRGDLRARAAGRGRGRRRAEEGRLERRPGRDLDGDGLGFLVT